MSQRTDLNSFPVTVLMNEQELWKAINITSEPLTHLIHSPETMREYASSDQIAMLTSSAVQGVHVLLSLLPDPPKRPQRLTLDENTPF